MTKSGVILAAGLGALCSIALAAAEPAQVAEASSAAPVATCLQSADRVRCEEDATIAAELLKVNRPQDLVPDSSKGGAALRCRQSDKPDLCLSTTFSDEIAAITVTAVERMFALEKAAALRRIEAAKCQAARSTSAMNSCLSKATVGISPGPAQAAEWVVKKKLLDEEAAEADRRAEEASRRAIAACKRKGIALGTVRIGMTSDEALYCGWGKPDHVNRTITSRRVSEQWVYGYHQYLYFEGDRLTTIQD